MLFSELVEWKQLSQTQKGKHRVISHIWNSTNRRHAEACRIDVTWGGVIEECWVLVWWEQTFILGWKVLEVDIDDGCTTVWMNLMPMNCTLKNVKMVVYCCMHFTEKEINRKGGRRGERNSCVSTTLVRWSVLAS